MTKTQPKVHMIDGKQYVEVDRKVEVGDLVTYSYNGKMDNVIVSVEEIDDEGVVHFDGYVDSSGEQVSGFGEGGYIVLEPIDPEEDDLVTATADNPDQIIELLGNLARRVTELEQRVNQSGENFTAKQVAEIIKALGVGAND